MSKMFFNDPSIFRGGITTPDPNEPTPPPIVVPGSVHGGLDPFSAMDSNTWLAYFGNDINGDNLTDINDYNAWWASMMQAGYPGFTVEAYLALNGTPFPTQQP